MIFQTLDDKNECVGIYSNGDLKFRELPEGLTKTWSYSKFLKGQNIEYAQIFADGKGIQEIVPEHLREEWNQISRRMKSFLSSFIEAKVSLDENCFFDLTPKSFLQKYCETKNKITQWVFDNYKKPEEYEFLRRFSELLIDIEDRDLNIDFELMKRTISKDKDLIHYRRLLTIDKNISYNLFGSITGRLSTNKKSFPIQNFPRAFRGVLKPTNDWFVAFDINAAELRTSLGLLEKDQPEEDLYEMISRDVFENKLPRKEVKEITTAWLYNANNEYVVNYADKLDAIFWKETLLNSYWDGKHVYTPYNRKIESDKFHAIPYLNQSTFIDLFHRQVIKVDDYLQDKKSFVSFLLHDELVLDVSDDEKKNIIDVIKILQDTQFGKFIVNVKAGRDYGNMKKLKLKVD